MSSDTAKAEYTNHLSLLMDESEEKEENDIENKNNWLNNNFY